MFAAEAANLICVPFQLVSALPAQFAVFLVLVGCGCGGSFPCRHRHF